MPTAAGRLDPDDVAGVQLARQFRRLLLAVDEGSTARTVLPAVPAGRRVAPALGEHREAAVLEHAQLAHDAVATAVRSRTAGASPQLPALDAQRVFQLERLDGSRQRVRHRDVDAARAVGVRAGSLAAADGLVVREAVVAEGDVVHRPLPRGAHRE